jgi:hypothetical protein
MEIVGIIKEIGDTATFGEKGFKKRELTLVTDEKYQQTLMIEFTQDRVDLLNSLHRGDNIRVSINLRGREWTNKEGVTKVFNSIHGWRVDYAVATIEQSGSLPSAPSGPSGPAKSTDDFDNLPF